METLKNNTLYVHLRMRGLMFQSQRLLPLAETSFWELIIMICSCFEYKVYRNAPLPNGEPAEKLGSADLQFEIRSEGPKDEKRTE
jgi:hypothetical protein